MKYLRHLRPQAEIVLLCREGLGPFFESTRLVDKAFEIRKGNSSSYQQVLSQIKNFDFEWVFCPHESFTSAWFQKNLIADRRISFSQWWNSLFFTDRVTKDSTLPDALRQMSLIAAVDEDLRSLIASFDRRQKGGHELIQVPDWASMHLFSPTSEISSGMLFDELRKKFLIEGDFAVIFPGSTWETKKWTQEGFRELALHLELRGMQVLFLGSKSEHSLCESLAVQIPRARNLAGLSELFETLLILKHSKIAICNDSGGQHLASLAGAPTLSIFGPTVLNQGFRPWNSKALISEREGLSCRPCGRHGHQKCPLGTHECMKNLSSKQVIEMANKLL